MFAAFVLGKGVSRRPDIDATGVRIADAGGEELQEDRAALQLAAVISVEHRTLRAWR